MFVASIIFTLILALATFLPLVRNQHWIFRTPDFGRIQLFFLQLILCVFLVVFPFEYSLFFLGITVISLMYNALILFKYTRLYKVKRKEKYTSKHSSYSLISANVYQFNSEKNRFIQTIEKNSPDMFLTMESDEHWEKAMQILEKKYPFTHKVTLSNTYGMHFYSRLPIVNSRTHYFVSDDIPCIEAKILLSKHQKLRVFAVHPPPPSPTEETTSKERDGELLSVAKNVKQNSISTVVVGDFNNVAWARSSVLFRKMSELIDPRIGRGFISTFHAKYFFLRFPIDHIFHSSDIFVDDIKALENIGSDHLPLYVKFHIDSEDDLQESEIDSITNEEKQEVETLIQEGIQEEGDRSKYE